MSTCVICGLTMYQVRRCKLTVGFHKFPTEPVQRQAWVDFCAGGGVLDDSPKVSGSICSDHFEEECFRGGGKRVSEPGKRHVLNDGAVPTIWEGALQRKLEQRVARMQQRIEQKSMVEVSGGHQFWCIDYRCQDLLVSVSKEVSADAGEGGKGLPNLRV